MLASITSNPGAIVKIKINIKIKKTQDQHHILQVSDKRHNSTKIHNQVDPDQGALSGLHPSIMHMKLGKKYLKIFGVI